MRNNLVAVFVQSVIRTLGRLVTSWLVKGRP